MNFATFYAQAAQEKNRKVGKGRNKGQPKSILKKKKELQMPGSMYYRDANGSQAPSGSTFVAQG
jgi:hypothetical protein